jgi:hypothetical protein
MMISFVPLTLTIYTHPLPPSTPPPLTPKGKRVVLHELVNGRGAACARVRARTRARARTRMRTGGGEDEAESKSMGEGEGCGESEEGAEWENAEWHVTAARGVVAQGHRNCCPRL